MIESVVPNPKSYEVCSQNIIVLVQDIIYERSFILVYLRA